MRVLVLGGGVIGASIAYRLAVRGADVTVLERSAIACGASGKAGASWRGTGATEPFLRTSPAAASTFTPNSRTILAAIGAIAA